MIALLIMLQKMQKYFRVLVYIWRKGYDVPASHGNDELANVKLANKSDGKMHLLG